MDSKQLPICIQINALRFGKEYKYTIKAILLVPYL